VIDVIDCDSDLFYSVNRKIADARRCRRGFDANIFCPKKKQKQVKDDKLGEAETPCRQTRKSQAQQPETFTTLQ
jgi:hypothetical protein